MNKILAITAIFIGFTTFSQSNTASEPKLMTHEAKENGKENEQKREKSQELKTSAPAVESEKNSKERNAQRREPELKIASDH